MAESLSAPGWEQCWPDPRRAGLLSYEPIAEWIRDVLGEAACAEYLAAARAVEEELSEGRGGSERLDAARARVDALYAEVVGPR